MNLAAENAGLVQNFLIVTDQADDGLSLAGTLERAGAVERLPLGEGARPNCNASSLVVDINLRSYDSIRLLRDVVRTGGLAEVPKIFLVNPNDYQGDKQARALGADRLIERPVQPGHFLEMLRANMADSFKECLERSENVAVAAGVRAAHEVLETIFVEMPKGSLLNVRDVANAESLLVDSIKEGGLGGWLETVKTHHSTSYRHSLFVTGTAISFAQFMGMSRNDQRRLARAALVHDVGKAFISLDVLDKPGRLTDAEFGAIKSHPELGYESLKRSGGFPAETLDAVLHHHEYLDGSGYPHRLRGDEISDLVRMVTIADIFAALAEERAYKPAFAPEAALRIMRDMDPRLDPDLLRIFGKMIAEQAQAA